MTYYVTYKIDAHFRAAVDANNIEEAKRKAAVRFSDADFGEAENIDGAPIQIEWDEGELRMWETLKE